MRNCCSTTSQPKQTISFKIRSVNKDGYSDWSTFSVKTKSNPLEFAIKGIRGEVTAEEQEGFEISRLFDYAELGDMFHTKYRKNAMPFDMIIDLRTINQLDKFHYLSRQDGATERSLPATWPTAWIRKTGQRSTRSAGNVMVT